MDNKAEKQDKPFRFMDLAPELRILIYENVLVNHPAAKLSRNAGGRNISSSSALPRVSKQVRSEFLNVLMVTVPTIETTVLDFCFGHIVTFLNRLPDQDLERMTSANAKQTLRITLEFPNPIGNVPQLNRWLKRATHPTKKGSKIDFQYFSAEGNDRQSYWVPKDGQPEAVKIKKALWPEDRVVR